MRRCDNRVLQNQHTYLVVFSCGIHFLQGHVSLHCKKMEGERQVYSPSPLDSWWVVGITACMQLCRESVLSPIGILIPFLPVIVTLFRDNKGYTIHSFPPFACGVEERDLLIYITLFLRSAMLVMGFALLIIVAWRVCKVCVVLHVRMDLLIGQMHALEKTLKLWLQNENHYIHTFL